MIAVARHRVTGGPARHARRHRRHRSWPAQRGRSSATNGLVVNGEQIADQQLWSAASRGHINLYSGYTENTEAALLKQFKADTGIEVKLVRLTPNRLYERISAEYGAGKLKADVVRISDSGFATR